MILLVSYSKYDISTTLTCSYRLGQLLQYCRSSGITSSCLQRMIPPLSDTGRERSCQNNNCFQPSYMHHDTIYVYVNMYVYVKRLFWSCFCVSTTSSLPKKTFPQSLDFGRWTRKVSNVSTCSPHTGRHPRPRLRQLSLPSLINRGTFVNMHAIRTNAHCPLKTGKRLSAPTRYEYQVQVLPRRKTKNASLKKC